LLQQLQPFDRDRTIAEFETGVGDPARRRFEQETLPGIAERFSSFGGTRGSGFRQELAGAGANLESNLASLLSQTLGAERGRRESLQADAISKALGYAQAPQASLSPILGLTGQALGTQAFAPTVKPATPSPLAPLLQAAGMAGGSYFGGMAGQAGVNAALQRA